MVKLEKGKKMSTKTKSLLHHMLTDLLQPRYISVQQAKDEINVPIALSAFRDTCPTQTL